MFKIFARFSSQHQNLITMVSAVMLLGLLVSTAVYCSVRIDEKSDKTYSLETG